MLRFTIFFFLFLFTPFTKAETYSYTNFSIREGLPSSEIHDILQDENGFMWFATSRGIVKYDGYEFEVFNIENGLKHNIVFHISQGKNGKIWFDSSNGDICYYQNGKIFEYDHNKTIHHFIKSPLIGFFHVDDNENIHIGTFFNGYLKISPNGRAEHYNSEEFRSNIIIIEGHALSYRNTRERTKEQFINLIYPSSPALSLFNKEIKKERITSTSLLISDSSFYAGFHNKLFKISPGKIQFIKSFPSQINCIYSQSNKLYCGLSNNGCVTLDIEDNYCQLSTELEQYSISDIHYDEKINLLWFTSLEAGVFSRSMTNNYIINDKTGLSSNFIYKLHEENNELVAFSQKKEYNFIDFNSKRVKKILQKDETNKFPSFVINRFINKLFVHYGLTYLADLKNERPINLADREAIFPVSFCDKDRLIGLQKRGQSLSVGEVLKDTFITYDIQCPFSYNDIFSFAHTTKSGKIFIVFQNGIFELILSSEGNIPKNIVSHTTNHSLLKTRITDIHEYDSETILFGTEENGIVFLKNKKTFSLNKSHGLLSNHINTLYVDSTQTIWVGSSKGISIIKRNQSILNLTQGDGLISNEITDIIIKGDEAFIATKKGINVFRTTELIKSNIETPVFIKEINLANNKRIPVTDSIQLRYNEPIIDIKFVGLNYRANKNIKYKYRFNESESWNYSDNNRIMLNNQPPGKYKLEIYASITGGKWSRKPATLVINIAYPFWRTNWFYASLVMTLFSVFILFNKISNRQIRKQERIKREVQQLRFKALNAQMNPHFIFNSLNSIQNFIISGNKKDSVRYLSKFAKLMREVLNHSQQQQISLEQEITALKTYMDLEVFRFDSSIEYTINIDDNIDLINTAVPPLLLQPIVENAIIHGLRPKSNGGEIEINISYTNPFLKIDVIDNGIGYQPPKKDKNHISKGENLVIDRLALFAKKNNSIYKYKITNLTQKNTGTKVSIQLPLTQIKDQPIL